MSGCFLADRDPRRHRRSRQRPQRQLPLQLLLRQLQQRPLLLPRVRPQQRHQGLLLLRGLFPRQEGGLLPCRDRDSRNRRMGDIDQIRSPFRRFSLSPFPFSFLPEIRINSRQRSNLRLRTAPARRSRFVNLNPLHQFNALTTSLI